MQEQNLKTETKIAGLPATSDPDQCANIHVMLEFYILPKNIFPDFFFGGGAFPLRL